VGALVKQEVYGGEIKDFLDSGGLEAICKPIGRGTVIGFFMGIFPGVGAIVPTLISYVIEKRLSKHPERFGTGRLRGWRPLRLAIMLQWVGHSYRCSVWVYRLPQWQLCYWLPWWSLAFIRDLCSSRNRLISSGCNFQHVCGKHNAACTESSPYTLWVRVLRIPYSYLYTMILVFCLIGAYSVNNSITDVIVMIVFEFLGISWENSGMN